jgi:hypothetical protein
MFKLGFYFLIILILFAILPESFLNNLKKFLNWENFVQTLKTGFANFSNFLKEAFGIDINEIFIKFKSIGIDFPLLWLKIKTFISEFFLKISNIFK